MTEKTVVRKGKWKWTASFVPTAYVANERNERDHWIRVVEEEGERRRRRKKKSGTRKDDDLLRERLL